MKFVTLTEVINEECKDKEFAKLFQRKCLINDIATLIVQLRKKSRLTQKELAKKAGTTQPVIARLECGNDRRVPSLELIAKLAIASNATLRISVE
ncbi:MAG: hypothetical protein A2X78_00030 [Gammaproteobacteria bacterium GWE2_37_16]|nr:MAG: hypothetical protein A2X78_00030 [Gammaproteobacteria bacterium GWE2_37_16]